MGDSPNPSGLVQGTLDMLIFRTLALEPMHGYGIGVSSRSAAVLCVSMPVRSSLRCGVSSPMAKSLLGGERPRTAGARSTTR
jgi:hypothetical protein